MGKDFSIGGREYMLRGSSGGKTLEDDKSLNTSATASPSQRMQNNQSHHTKPCEWFFLCSCLHNACLCPSNTLEHINFTLLVPVDMQVKVTDILTLQPQWKSRYYAIAPS